MLWIVLMLCLLAVGAFLVWKYVDLPFGTPKSARLKYEAEFRARRRETE